MVFGLPAIVMSCLLSHYFFTNGFILGAIERLSRVVINLYEIRKTILHKFDIASLERLPLPEDNPIINSTYNNRPAIIPPPDQAPAVPLPSTVSSATPSLSELESQVAEEDRSSSRSRPGMGATPSGIDPDAFD